MLNCPYIGLVGGGGGGEGALHAIGSQRAAGRYGSWDAIVVFMKLRILPWNVQGLNNPNKRVVVKNKLEEWKGDLLCLQETKIDKMEQYIVRSLCGSPSVDWVAAEAMHTVSGILLMWYRWVLRKIET